MRSSRVYVLAIVAALAGVVVLNQSLAQDNPAAVGSSKVAVCDIAQVFDGYVRGQELTTDFLKRGEKLKAEDQQRLKAIDDLSAELEGLLEGSGEYERRFKEVQRLKIDRQVWMKYETGLVERDQLRFMKQMYGEIVAMAGKIAAQRGIDIVLFHKTEQEKAETLTQLLQQMESRKVIYASKSVDITDDVLLGVNEAHRLATP